ncbi:PAS domain-containing protein [Mitsuokella jalaludinii]|uniref:PAS domain-containing protein n=1 Tax=Mitsuokella jalaludinii TaxID=187979 RepID=UPI003079DE2B
MTLQFSEKEVKGEIARLSEEYDIVRLVDPEECHSFAIGADCSYEYGPSCYSVWRSTNRCRNCMSLRALKTGMELHKTEIKDGDLYFITSRPIEILRADGTTFSCVMELIRIERGKGMKKDGHRAVLQEGFDKRAFAETLRVAMQNLPTGVVWFDRERPCIYANSEAFRIFDVPDSLAKLEVILKDWFQEDALSSPEATVWLQQYREKESPR